MYMRIIVAVKEKGTRTKITGQTLHKKLTYSPWQRATLLKLIYGQLYKGMP